jgi:flagellar biosynthesis protein
MRQPSAERPPLTAERPSPEPNPPGPNAAVALSYERGRDAAPLVVASGRGGLAERIVAAARASGVAVHVDPDLVELLAAVELGTTIPVEAFVAVAQILSHLYRANRRAAGEP